MRSEDAWIEWLEMKIGNQPGNRSFIRDLIRAVRAEQVARDAEIAEKWCDEFEDSPGCSVAHNEGLECSAPKGIAAAIRAGGTP